MIGMYVLKSDKTLFVDVDDTLVMWKGNTYTPHKKHIAMIKKLHARGQPVVVWSAGGLGMGGAYCKGTRPRDLCNCCDGKAHVVGR